ncbi:MAG: hypothetical protein ACYC2U_03790 [Candidatus Amoebophilus sp.]
MRRTNKIFQQLVAYLLLSCFLLESCSTPNIQKEEQKNKDVIDTPGSQLQPMAIPGKLIFGNRRSAGTFHHIQDTGGKTIIFKAGWGIDAIQIGNNIYGGGGGREVARAQLPENGQFTIEELRSYTISDRDPLSVTYIKGKIGGTPIEVGATWGDWIDTVLKANLTVKISGITVGTGDYKLVESIQFDVIGFNEEDELVTKT